MIERALKHKPSNKTIIRFLLLLGVFVAYFLFLSWKYDVATGGMVSALTWSFFVLCTPVADAGFLLDFPVRLIADIRMLVSEIAVWIIAIFINVWALNFYPHYYDKTVLTQLFHKILITPWPYWGVILLCAFGTFFSIWLGDEIMDAFGRKTSRKLSQKHRNLHIGGTVALFAVIMAVYYHLLSSLGISIEGLE